MKSQFKTLEIESAMNQLMQEKNVSISAVSLAAFLGINTPDEELVKRLTHFLLGEESLYTVDDENFMRRADFFNKKTFVVVPTADEIKDKILIIGHRFQTFMNPDIFPSELTVRYGRKNIVKKNIVRKLQDIFPYHMLMGAEQLSDFFIGEDERNAHWNSKAGYLTNIHFSVLDMDEFYTANNMNINDALVFTVNDYDKGIFKISKLDAEDRDEVKIVQWCRDFEDAVGEVADRYESYLDLPEQLRMAYFIGEDKFFGTDGAALDEFIKRAESIEIAFDSDHTILIRKEDQYYSTNNADAVPEGISISGGDNSSLQSILKEIGSSLTETEIDSYILESCFDRDKDFDVFLNKVFDMDKLNFADEAQKTVFINFIEAKFEDISEKYNRFNDEEKAPLRSRILELITSRNDFFNYIRSLDIDEKNIPQEEMKKIASGSLHLNNILQMLNDERHDLSEDDKDAIFEAVESAEDILNDSMESLETALNI